MTPDRVLEPSLPTGPVPLDAKPPASRGARIAAWAGWSAFFVLLWLELLALPVAVPLVQLDRSWYSLLAHDWLEGLQAGRDFIFTYGPLAGVLTPAQGFDLDVHKTQIGGALVAVAAVALMLTALVRLVPSWIGKVGAALLLLYTSTITYECLYPLGIIAGTAWVLHRGPTPARALPVCTFLAAVGLVKFTSFVLSAACVGAMALAAWRHRSWRAAAIVAGGYVAAFLVWWLIAGQSITGIPRWLWAASEISWGYNDVMTMRGPSSQLAAGASCMVLLAGMCAWTALARPRDIACVMLALVGMATSFVLWKGAFVQHDEGHALLFFGSASLVPFALLPALARKERGRRATAAAAAAVGVLAVLGVEMERGEGSGLLEAPNILQWRPRHNWQALGSLGSFVDQQTQEWHRLAAETPMPETRRELGEGTIDAFGFEQGILFANRLRVRHRPVFQSYSAYTPALQELNAACYESPDGPDHVLFKLQPIYDYMPTVADSQALLALLAGYEPRLQELGFVLLKRKQVPRRRADAPMLPLLDRSVVLGEWVDLAGLPGDLRLLSLDIAYSLEGRLRSFLLRPPKSYLELRLDDGQLASMRIAPAVARAPFLLDPLLRTTPDFLRLQGGMTLPRVTSFRVVAAAGKEGLFDSRVGVRLSACDGLRRKMEEMTAAEREHIQHCLYPMLHSYPFEVRPGRNFETQVVGKTQVLLAHAPSELQFRLPAGRHVVSGTFGILDAAFAGDCRTDGVGFRVVRQSGSERVEVFARLLRPLESAGDRGEQRFSVQVESAGDEVLLFIADPGPAQDNRWDWSWWTDIRIAGS